MNVNSQDLPAHYRWNFIAFLVDYICFTVALTFANISSVMPAFVAELTDSAPIIGLVGTVFQSGWLLPQLGAAHMISDKPRKKPYLLLGLIGRVLFWVIALALWIGLARHPTAMLIVFYVCLALFVMDDGIATVAWFDILARAIPLKQRGRLMGIAQVVSGVLGIGAGALVRVIVERRPFPGNYALIFGLTGAILVPSAVALSLLREPPPDEPSPEPTAGRRRNWLRILSSDPAFRRLMACRIMVGLVMLAIPFYVVHAGDVLHLPEAVIGDFVIAQTLAGVVASAVMGLVNERMGPRYVIRIGSAAAAAGPLFALAAHLVGGGWTARAYPFVFVTLGVLNSAYMLGFFNYLLEIAPDGLRPAYVGLGNTIMGLLSLVPIVGGWLLEATSYTALFGLTGALVVVGFLLSLKLQPVRPETVSEQAP